MKDMAELDKELFWRAGLALVLMMSCLAGLSAPARAESVAIVTDVAGRVAMQGGPAHGEIGILDEIEPDTRLQVDGGARLVVLYLASGNEYAFSGPAQVQFRANEPRVVSGAQPQKRASPLGRSGQDVTIKPFRVTPGAMVMRGNITAARIKLLTVTDTRILESAPEFRWQEVEPGLKYQFELNDVTGESLFEIQVEGVALKLPPAIRLQEDIGYKWTVSARLADGRRYVNSGNFSIAPADLRRRVEAL